MTQNTPAITPEIVIAGIAFYLVTVVIAGIMLARRGRRVSAATIAG